MLFVCIFVRMELFNWFRKKTCKHEHWHKEWFSQSYFIRVCDDCGFEDHGFKRDKIGFYQEWTIK